MEFFTDVPSHEVLWFPDVFLESTVVVRVRLEAEGSLSNAVHFHIAAVRVSKVSCTLRQLDYMVTMGLLEHDPWESVSCELINFHESLHESLFEKFIGRFNPFPS